MENSRFANVDQALASLIAAWPTLFKSREDALLRFASQSWSSKGQPEREDESSDQDLHKTFDQLVADTAGRAPGERSTYMRALDNRMALDRLREQNDALFTRANANLIASLDGDFSLPPRLSIYDVNRWPATLAPGWKEAMVELADKILDYQDSKVEKHTDSPVSRGQYAAGLKEAKETAKEIIARYAPERISQVEAVERNDKINKLRYAAEALGFKLTPVQN